jgi:hypothetical protein
MADIKAKKVLFKNRDGEHLIPYVGEDFVEKSGDTMTGNLNINKDNGQVAITGTSYKGIRANCTDIDYTSTTQTTLQGGRLISVDKNGQYFGVCQSGIGSDSNIYTKISARRNINGTDKTSEIACSVKKDGTTEVVSNAKLTSYVNHAYSFVAKSTVMNNTTTPSSNQYVGIDFRDKNDTRMAYLGVSHDTQGNKFITLQNQGNTDGFSFPRCTTKPTTTSTASGTKVAVVVQNYLSGTSWYRVWSDGWKEQGGRASISNGLATSTVTFLKAFSDANYSIQAQAISSGSFANMDEEAGVHILSITKSNVVFESTWASTTTSKTITWYACGY